MKYDEMKQAVNLLAEEWNLGKRESKQKEIFVHGYI